MKNKVATAMTIFVLLASMLTLTFNIQPVKAEWVGHIMILPDGSVYPDDAPISVDDNVYTLTDDIITYYSDIIRVYRSNIILDGAGHTILLLYGRWESGICCVEVDNVEIRNFVIKGRGVRAGIELLFCTNCVVSGNTIISDAFSSWIRYSIFLGWYSDNNIIYGNTILGATQLGIWVLGWSDYNIISGNTITGTAYSGGIQIAESSYNTISENNIELTERGIHLYEASDNTFFHNNLIDNTQQVYDISWDYPEHPPSVNTWDNGYPSGGNYWSDYEGIDTNDDGIGDTPHFIYTANQDNYPLMEPSWTPPEAIEELTEIIEAWNLHKKAESSLLSKLGDALQLLDKGNLNGAIHKLGDFIDQVEAQREKALTNEQADYLILKAQIIISQI